jgi:hypothetical protein
MHVSLLYYLGLLKSPPLLLSTIDGSNDDTSKDINNNDNDDAPDNDDAKAPKEDHKDMSSKAKTKATASKKPPTKVAVFPPPTPKSPPLCSTPLTCMMQPSLHTTTTRGLTTPKLRSTSMAWYPWVHLVSCLPRTGCQSHGSEPWTGGATQRSTSVV